MTGKSSRGKVASEKFERPASTVTRPAALSTWVGKKRAGRLLDGVTHDAYPEGAHNV